MALYSLAHMVSVLALLIQPVAPQDDYRLVTLTGNDGQNRPYTVVVYLPDAETGRYRGSRFAHVPMVGLVRWSGHTFFGEWNPGRGNPEGHDSNALGTAEEFDIDGPKSFAAARPGDTFLKVGVGFLVKPGNNEPYRFLTNYTVARRPTLSVKTGRDFAEVTQTLTGENGRQGYKYVHRVQLLPGQAGFVIHRNLTNLGEIPLETEHYCHNFVSIDNTPLGPDYQLKLAFPLATPDAEGAKATGLTWSGTTAGFSKLVAPSAPVWARLTGYRRGEKGDAAFEIHHKTARVGVRVRTGADGLPLQRFHLYGAAGALCPEPFLEINLAPQETRRWDTTYEFFTLSPAR